MTQIVELTVLFADLRGSTSLFETLGNAEATSVVTHCTGALARAVEESGGTVVKTLGDGIMATFERAGPAWLAAQQMHEVLEAIVSRGRERGASSGLRALRLQIAIARGEVVRMGGDCYGDAVNVAARLVDHAGDNETLATAEALADMPGEHRSRFRRLDHLVLRGRVEPVEVHVAGGRRVVDVAPTAFGDFGGPPMHEPDGLRLTWQQTLQVFASEQMPVVMGRSPQAHFLVDDNRVSRQHCRVDWHGGAFQLTDLSFNGTYVRFADGEIVSLRRGSCTLHGSGTIGLGGSPRGEGAPCVDFDTLRFAETQPASAAP